MSLSLSRKFGAALPTLTLLAALGAAPSAHAGLMLKPVDAGDNAATVKQPVSHFDRVLLNSAWRNLLDITLSGLLDGKRVYQQTIHLNDRGAVMFDFRD